MSNVARQPVTTLDKIRKYYLKGPEKARLTEKQQAIRVLAEKAWNLFITYKSTREQAVNVLMNENGCSRAQAYRYINIALSIFGNPMDNQDTAERYLLLEDIKEAYQQARKEKNLFMMEKLLSLRAKVVGNDNGKDPNFDPEKLQAQIYVIKPHETVIKAIENSRNGSSYDFNMLDCEEIPYKEVTPEEDEH